MAEDPLLREIKTMDIPLTILDSVHDFCTKERKKKEVSSAADDDDDDQPSETKVEFMRQFLTELVTSSGKVSEPVTNYIDLIKNLTEDNVTSISNFENQVVSYYEDVKDTKELLKTDVGECEVLTFQTILDAYTTRVGGQELKDTCPLWSKYRLNRDTNFRLEINKGTKSINTYTESERNIIANFILNYFFIDVISPAKCTFDAKAGVVGKIFNDIEQVRNVIFPQTIADSATTTFSAMRGRNDFVFPSGLKPFPFVSNYYTNTIYNMNFYNINFTNKNPYNFQIVIQRKDDPKVELTLPFSETQTEGPSVNYLIEILEKIRGKATKGAAKSEEFKNISKKKQILSLGKYIDASPQFKIKLVEGIWDKKDGLLLDLKRGGDHEAAAVTQYIRTKLFNNFIFVTIDLLCALESRRRQNPTIWHYGERMLLYRFPVSQDQNKQTKVLVTIDKINNAIDSCSIIKNLFTQITEQLTKVKAEAVRGKTAQVSYVATVKDRGLFISTQAPPRDYQGDCEKILTKLLRLRMGSLERQVNQVQTKLTGKTYKETLYAGPDGQDDFEINLQLLTAFGEGLEAFKTKLKPKRGKAFAWPDEPEEIELEFPNGSGGTVRVTLNTIFERVQTITKETIVQINSVLGLNITLGVEQSGQLKQQIELYKKLISCRDSANQYKICRTEDSPSNRYCFEKDGAGTYSQNSMFDYNSLPFFEFYKTLLEMSKAADTAVATAAEDTRVYTNSMRSLALKLHKLAQQILNQLDGAEKTEALSFPLFNVDTNPIYKTTDPVFSNFFTNFNDAFFNAIEILPAPARGGSLLQIGGFDQQQYYDSADL